MSQARLPRTEPSTELITAHKVNNCDAHAALQTRDFSALPKHRVRRLPKHRAAPVHARYMASQAPKAWQVRSGAACQARGGPWQARVGLDGAGRTAVSKNLKPGLSLPRDGCV